MDNFTNPFRAEIVVDPSAPIGRRKFRRRRRGRMILFLASITVIGVLGYLLARPTFRVFKGWRANRLVSQAEGFAGARNVREASRLAYAAYLLEPGNVRNLRLIGRLFSDLDSDRAVDFWRRVLEIEPADAETRRILVRDATRFRLFAAAENQARQLVESGKPEAKDLLLVAELARAQRDSLRELQMIKAAEVLLPEDKEVHFRLLRARLETGSIQERESAIADLKAAAGASDSLGAEAARALAMRGGIAPEEAVLWAQRLREHPAATMQQRVDGYAVQLINDPGSRTSLLEQIESSARASAGFAAVVSPMLIQAREFDRVLRILPWDLAKTSEELSFIHLDALTRAGRKEDAGRLMDTGALLARPELAELCRWQAAERVASRSDDKRARSAIDSAAGRVDSLIFLGARFEEANRDDLAALAFNRLNRIQPQNRPALLGLLRIARRNGDTKELLRLMETIAEDAEYDAGLRNEIAYYRLLLNQDAAVQESLAVALVAEAPDRVVYRATLALAKFRSGDVAGGLQLFDEVGFEWQKANAPARVVYASLLAAAGRSTLASEVVSSLRVQGLLPEEKDLLGGLFVDGR